MTKISAPTKKDDIIHLSQIDTPLGSMYAGAVNDGICLLEFADRKDLQMQFQKIEQLYNANIEYGSSKYFDMLEDQLQEYFAGHRKDFEVPLALNGTEFQRRVWHELLNIPFGAARSYQQLALAIQKPKSFRAVANAIGANRIAMLIPCHRVIGTNGKLTGYAWGTWRKKWLLALEIPYS